MAIYWEKPCQNHPSGQTNNREGEKNSPGSVEVQAAANCDLLHVLQQWQQETDSLDAQWPLYSGNIQILLGEWGLLPRIITDEFCLESLLGKTSEKFCHWLTYPLN
jgi:hypothetical protein